jgi:phosphate transport system substrate-binding protein
MDPRSFFVVFFMIMGLFSCNQTKSTKEKTSDTVSSGTIRVSVDETLQPLMEAEFRVFANDNPDAHLEVSYKPENEVLKDFFNDSARAVILTRELTKAEKDYFLSIQYAPRLVPFAKDGISLIVNTEEITDSIKISELQRILTGKGNPDMKVVFDNTSSSTVRWLNDSLVKEASLGKNCFALRTNPEVIRYVAENKNTIGIIGNSWISDRDDSNVTNRFRQIKRLRVAAPGSKDYLEPLQSEIETGRYALARLVYCGQRDGKIGLGTGLQHFLYGEKGQLIVLKFGLMPYNTPERSIILKHE